MSAAADNSRAERLIREFAERVGLDPVDAHRSWLDWTAERVVVRDTGHGSPCWLWQKATNSGGYGVVQFRRKRKLAHRVVFELLRGPIPNGLVLDHECERHDCVNPWHCAPRTPLDNIRRGRNHNRDKTHCVNGHEFTPENTQTRPDGNRNCRTCRRRWNRERHRRDRERRAHVQQQG